MPSRSSPDMLEDKHPTTKDPARGGLGYEPKDAHVRAILWLGLALALLCAFAIFTSGWVFKSFDRRLDAEQRPLHPLAALEEIPPGPRLQPAPARDLDTYLRNQQEVLESYGWLDPEAGTVRVPVERALELVLEEGLPSVVPSEPREAEGGR